MIIFSKNKNLRVANSDTVIVWLNVNRFYPYSSRTSSTKLNNLFTVAHDKIVLVYEQTIYLACYKRTYVEYLQKHGFTKTEDYKKILDKVLQVFETPVDCNCGDIKYRNEVFPVDINRHFLLTQQYLFVTNSLLGITQIQNKQHSIKNTILIFS
jgi:hypothetical protein